MLRRIYRIPLLIALLLAGLAIVFCVFPLLARPAHERIIASWSRLLMRCCGTLVRERIAPGAAPLAATAGAMLLSNHISWIDIFAIDSIAAAVFVAKAEVARWPLVGTLVSRAGTVFIERSRRHAVHDVIARLEQRIRSGHRVAVFPEGTTSDGTCVLPFYGNLAQAAIGAHAPVVPVALRYIDAGGQPTRVPVYVGDTHFLASLWQVTGHPRLIVEVHVLPAIVPAPGMTRQELARRVRDAISRHLELALEDRVPATLRGRRA